MWLRRGFLRKARSEARGISFMDLVAPCDDVLAQKDQANNAFLLHGSGIGRRPILPLGASFIISMVGFNRMYSDEFSGLWSGVSGLASGGWGSRGGRLLHGERPDCPRMARMSLKWGERREGSCRPTPGQGTRPTSWEHPPCGPGALTGRCERISASMGNLRSPTEKVTEPRGCPPAFDRAVV